MNKKIGIILLVVALICCTLILLISTSEEDKTAVERINIEREYLPRLSRTEFAKERGSKVNSIVIPAPYDEEKDKEQARLKEEEERQKKLLINKNQHKSSPAIQSYIAPKESQDHPHDSAAEERNLRMQNRRQAVQQSWEGTSTKSNIVTSRGIRAVIHGNQIIEAGQSVTVRSIEQHRFDDGTTLERNTLIFGIASIVKDRLIIEIRNIRIDSEIFPISLSVYATDGMAGIPVTGQEVKKESSNSIVSSATSQASSAAKSYGSWIGTALGSATDIAVGKMQSERKNKIQLIDNQTVYLL